MNDERAPAPRGLVCRSVMWYAAIGTVLGGEVGQGGRGSPLGTFWFFMWRMTLLGPILGVTLGAVYGFCVPALATLPLALTAEGTVTSSPGGVLNALALMTLFGGFFGAALGATFGAGAGLVLGPLDGVVLVVLTLIFHRHSSTDPGRYRRAAGTACALASTIALFVLWVWPYLTAEYTVPTFGAGTDLALLVIVPCMVATLAMGLSGGLIARCYARGTGRGGVGARASGVGPNGEEAG